MVQPSSYSMTDKLKSLIENLKHLPGVYLMFNKNDTIIYVGKAKDLYKRVSQYFLRPQEGKVFRMVMEVEYFKTIITNNEKEALILEMNLIHEHYPKYNILLKDGSHYPYIALRKKNDPILQIKRNKKDKNYIYFGPFPNANACREIINLLNKVFPLRKCKNIPSSPCLYYHLSLCLAPCINKVNNEEYEEMILKIKSFLNGDNAKYKKLYVDKMNLAIENLEFEKAREYKNIIDSIDHLNMKQNVETNDKKDRDIFAYATKPPYLSLAVLTYRNGILLGKNTFVVEEFLSNEEQVADLINQYYLSHELPDEIIINSDEIISSLSNILDTKIISITKGKLLDMVTSAKENANNALDEYFLSSKVDENKIELLEELANILNIDVPSHIELFDNSHTHGSFPIGVMVMFINGEPIRKKYRKYHIEQEESQDDIASMKEIINRRLTRLIEENESLPDLILVDGGLTQTLVAKEVVDSLNLSINVFGLFKSDKHQTEGIIDSDGNIFKIENKNLFFLLTRMQDEVHRFAIKFHKELRDKSISSSIFDDIKGLGIKRKNILFKTYRDLESLKDASLEELSQLLPKEVATLLFDKLHNS
ncbi:MAG: excinuclease ABC subunit UvrC [Bacilli bacterium]